MPITSSAIKALRQDRTHAVANTRQRTVLRRALKTVTLETLAGTVSLIDKAVKNHLMHRNKAARLKSQLAKTIGITTIKRSGAGQTAKTTAKKTPPKKKVLKTIATR